MLLQFHWQNRDNLDETEMVAQADVKDFKDGDAFRAWVQDLITRRAGECPAGWAPLIIDETHGRFVWAAPAA